MAANNIPIYIAVPKQGQGVATTANTARDGTGTVATLLTAGTNGSKIERLEIMGVGTTANNIVRIFVSTDGGTTKRLFREFATSATTPSGTVAGFSTHEDFDNFVLPASALVYASVHTTGDIYNLFVEYGDF